MIPILIVDDNPINLKLMEALLAQEGYEIKTTSNANETLHLLLTFQPRLILMDIKLPDMDGFKLTQKIKSDPRYKNIIILALSAYDMEDNKEKSLAAGCADFISKPIDIKTFPNMIAKYLVKT